jgi:hypothetical protein
MPSVKIAPEPLKIGIDLDGVILYNPARLIRPVVSGFKKLVLKRGKTKFFIPKKPIHQWLFRLFHKSSIFVAPGLDTLQDLTANRKVSAYLITARFAFLKKDLDKWLVKINSDSLFQKCFYNEHDQQPHQYKAALIKKLNLDVFIEDNWDIVKFLEELRIKGEHHARVYWIYNLFDKRIPYNHKYPSLKEALKHLP